MTKCRVQWAIGGLNFELLQKFPDFYRLDHSARIQDQVQLGGGLVLSDLRSAAQVLKCHEDEYFVIWIVLDFFNPVHILEYTMRKSLVVEDLV